MSDISSNLSRSSKVRKVIMVTVMITVVAGSSSYFILNPDAFFFWEEDGIFPVINSPDPSGISHYCEGEPIILKTTAYNIKTGKIQSTSNDDDDFLESLNFTWYLRHEDWESSAILDSGRGHSEIALSSLKAGEYEVEVSIDGIDKKYNQLEPNDYLVNNTESTENDQIDYSKATFRVTPLINSQSWIITPKDYSNYVIGEPIKFSGYTSAVVNSSFTNSIAERSVDVYNSVPIYLTQSDINITLNGQKNQNSIDKILSNFETLDPIQLEKTGISNQLTITWEDQYIDPNGESHDSTIIGNQQDIEIADLELGFHTIKYSVTDEISDLTSEYTIHLWTSNKTQPTVPNMVPFFKDFVLDGNFLVSWDSAKPTTPGSSIANYELQKSKRADIFTLTGTIGNDDGIEEYLLSSDTNSKYFGSVESTTNTQYYENGKVWFRVRSVDSYGVPSYWSDPIGITIDKIPNNIHSNGIFLENGTRIDLYANSYQTSENGIIHYNEGGKIFQDTGNPTPLYSVFDLYPGQFDNSSCQSDYNQLFSNYPIDDINLPKTILQNENFIIKFSRNNLSNSIDLDNENSDLKIYVFSNLDGLIYRSSIYDYEIDWNQDIYRYLSNYRRDLPQKSLSTGVHTFTVFLKDNLNVGYQLPSMVINVTGWEPNWNGISLNTTASSFNDLTGDGLHDLSTITLEWENPNINPNYPFGSHGIQEWIENWFIEVQHEYGNDTIISKKRLKWVHYDVSNQKCSVEVNRLLSGNYTFRISVEDRNGWISGWSEPFSILNDNGEILDSPFETKLPILLNEDNPPPNPVISLANIMDYDDDIPIFYSTDVLYLSANQSTDLNHDVLTYTWLFDGELKLTKYGYPDYDPYAINISITPEICGNDVSYLEETDLLDGDSYGDWGIHEITLRVSDQASVVEKSIFIMILPPNVEPEFDYIDISNKKYDSETNTSYIYDTDSVVTYPSGLSHFDHELEPQNLTITTAVTNIETNNRVGYSISTISRDHFSDVNPVMEDQDLHQYGLEMHNLVVGSYQINITVSDGQSEYSQIKIFDVLSDPAPKDLSMVLTDEYDNELMKIDDKYVILPNQPINLVLDWADNSPDNELLMIVGISHQEIFYAGQPIHQFSTLENKIHFSESGECELLLTISDYNNAPIFLSIPTVVMHAAIFQTENTNTIAREISVPGKYLQGGNEQLTNYADVDRTTSSVALWDAQLGDDRLDTGTGYYTDTILGLDTVVLPNSEFIRVWFEIDVWDESDYLEFFDGDGNLVWKITSNKYGGYKYMDEANAWKSLKKMYLDSSIADLETRNMGEFAGFNKLAYVVIPGDTVSIQWTAGPSGNGKTNVFLKRGFRIGYYETFSFSEVKLRDPLDCVLDGFLDFLGADDDSLINYLVKSAWNHFIFQIETYATHEYDSRWIEVSHKIDYLETMEFEFTIRYNRFTTEFAVIVSMEFKIEKLQFIGQTMKDNGWEVLVGGEGIFNAILDPFILKEATIRIDGTLLKSIDLFDVLTPMPGVGLIAGYLKKASNFLERFGIKLPFEVNLFFKLSIYSGWRQDLGWFAFVDIYTGFEFRIFKSLITLNFGFGMTIGGSQTYGFTWGMYIDLGGGIRLTLKAIIGDYWWVPGTTLLSKKFTMTIHLPFF